MKCPKCRFDNREGAKFFNKCWLQTSISAGLAQFRSSNLIPEKSIFCVAAFGPKIHDSCHESWTQAITWKVLIGVRNHQSETCDICYPACWVWFRSCDIDLWNCTVKWNGPWPFRSYANTWRSSPLRSKIRQENNTISFQQGADQEKT